MIEHLKEKLKKLAELSKEEVGNNENSNFIIPLLDCFGHHRLDFEHSAQGNRIDIYIEKQS